MGDWLDTQRESGSSGGPDLRFLKLPDFASADEDGSTQVARVRFVDEKPVSAWRHWINNRPFNCPGKYAGCPVCVVRNEAIERNKEEGRNKYRMDHKWFINVLVLGTTNTEAVYTPLETPEMKVLAFGKELGQDLELMIRTKGDLRDYDIDYIKVKKGNAKNEVRYKVDRGEKYELSKEQRAVTETARHDLSEIVAMSTVETLRAALEGKTVEASKSAPVQDERYVPVAEVRTVQSQLITKGYNLGDFFSGIPENQIPKEEFAKVTAKLAQL